jgi:hypothetical protein
LGWHVHRGQGVPEPGRIDLDGRGAPPHCPSTLEFVDRQVDALTEQDVEGAFHALRPHELLQVTALAPSQVEKAAVRAVRVRVDSARDQFEEVRLAPRLALMDYRRRAVDRQGAAKVTRHATEEARGQAKVSEEEPVPDER